MGRGNSLVKRNRGASRAFKNNNNIFNHKNILIQHEKNEDHSTANIEEGDIEMQDISQISLNQKKKEKLKREGLGGFDGDDDNEEENSTIIEWMQMIIDEIIYRVNIKIEYSVSLMN